MSSPEINQVIAQMRTMATQTQLGDGTILVTGGIGLTGQPVDSAFLFDPATGKSTTLPAMASARAAA